MFFWKENFFPTDRSQQNLRMSQATATFFFSRLMAHCLHQQEYVASLIGLYKNNGAVLHVGNYFPFI